MQSFEFENLGVDNWDEIFKKSNSQSNGNIFTWGFNTVVNTVNSFSNLSRNKVRQEVNKHGRSFLDIANKLVISFSQKEKN